MLPSPACLTAASLNHVCPLSRARLCIFKRRRECGIRRGIRVGPRLSAELGVTFTGGRLGPSCGFRAAALTPRCHHLVPPARAVTGPGSPSSSFMTPSCPSGASPLLSLLCPCVPARPLGPCGRLWSPRPPCWRRPGSCLMLGALPLSRAPSTLACHSAISLLASF